MSTRVLRKFRQVSESEETNAAGYECMWCGGRWVGYVNKDPIQDGLHYPYRFRFCPCCGVCFEGLLEPSPAGIRHRELRDEAARRSHCRINKQEWFFTLECRHESEEKWRLERDYVPRSHRGILAAWRARLKAGSWFGEFVQLTAWNRAGGRKVVFGPVWLAPNTNRDDDE